MQEHRIIEIVISALEEMAERADQSGELDISDARDAVDFIKNFADKCHHGKEEERLFPAAAERGIPKERGPIGMMLHEHEIGRQHVRNMLAAIDKIDAGDNGAVDAFIEEARGYALLLRSHIHKEDNILFPMAQQVLSDDDQKQLLDEFEKVEHEEMGDGTHEKYLTIAKKLAATYNVEVGDLFSSHISGSCGCHD
jgi:hemerythrin-like domain-containing protein